MPCSKATGPAKFNADLGSVPLAYGTGNEKSMLAIRVPAATSTILSFAFVLGIETAYFPGGTFSKR